MVVSTLILSVKMNERRMPYIALIVLVIASLLTAGIPSPVLAATDSTTIGTLSLYPAFENIGVISSYSGDDNGNNQATLEYREAGSATWRPGIPMTVDRRDLITYYPGGGNPDETVPNEWARQWRAVIFGLEPNTEYEVRVTYTDPDGVGGTNAVTQTARTRDDNPSSNGNTYRVATTGSDETGDGSESNPWRTIQHAADIVIAGDRVLVHPGVYNEEVIISNKSGTENNYITFESLVEHGAVIDGQKTLYRNFQLQSSHYIRIKGFHLLNAAGNPVRASASNYCIIEDNICEDGYWTGDHWARGGIWFEDSSHHVTIQRNHIFRYRGGDHLETMGIMIQATANPFTGAEGGNVVRYNEIDGDFRDGISRSGGYLHGGFIANSFIYGNIIHDITDDDAIEMEGPDVNVAVYENIIYNVNNMALGLAPCSVGPLYILRNQMSFTDDALMKLGSTSHGYVYVYHNTMHNWTGNGNGPSSYGSNTKIYNQTYRNNIMLSSRTVVRFGGSTGDNETNSFDYNCYQSGSSTHKWKWGNAESANPGPSGDGYYADFTDWQSYTGNDANGIYSDPQFVDGDNRDYRLQGSSPCIDSGVILPGFNDANSPWPYSGSAPEMGVLEFESGVPPGPLHHITVTPTSVSVQVGQTQQFTATGYDQYDNEITGLSFTWSVVAGGGNITATSNTTALFTAGETLGTWSSCGRGKERNIVGC